MKEKASDKTVHNYGLWLLYSSCTFGLLIWILFWPSAIIWAILIGFLFMCLNSIVTELRFLNGEEFPKLGMMHRERRL